MTQLQLRILTILGVLLLNSLHISAQHISLSAGTVLGGPTPTETGDNATAVFKPGANLAVAFTLKRHNNFSFNTEIGFEYIAVGYGDKTRKDTTVNVDITLQNGNVITTPINTYYNSDVNGLMKLNFFKAGLTGHYHKNRFTFSLGSGLYLFSGGYDKGMVEVVIGEGGVEGLEVQNIYFNNSAFINRFSLLVSAGTSFQIFHELSLSAQLNRALTPFYDKNLIINDYDGKFYLTSVCLSLKYSFGMRDKS